MAVESREARDALSRLVESWHEPWASRWARAMVATRRPGDLDSQTINDLVSQVRRLLDHLDPTDAPSVNRTELAAKLFGSAHALDEGTKLAGAITQALQFGVKRGFQLELRELWKAAGIRVGRVSAPVLTWSLPVEGGSFLDEQVRQASAGGLPLHISLFALRRYPITVPPRTPVLVVESTRLVESAAERELPSCVIATNGNPTTAVNTLLQQLRESEASLSFHRDFDSWGIRICRRMYKGGDAPWMMDASDYQAAVDRAEQANIRLDQDPNDCGETPWDTDLRAAFNGRRRRIIHEEFVLDEVLSRFTEENR